MKYYPWWLCIKPKDPVKTINDEPPYGARTFELHLPEITKYCSIICWSFCIKLFPWYIFTLDILN